MRLTYLLVFAGKLVGVLKILNGPMHLETRFWHVCWVDSVIYLMRIIVLYNYCWFCIISCCARWNLTMYSIAFCRPSCISIDLLYYDVDDIPVVRSCFAVCNFSDCVLMKVWLIQSYFVWCHSFRAKSKHIFVIILKENISPLLRPWKLMVRKTDC